MLSAVESEMTKFLKVQTQWANFQLKSEREICRHKCNRSTIRLLLFLMYQALLVVTLCILPTQCVRAWHGLRNKYRMFPQWMWCVYCEVRTALWLYGAQIICAHLSVTETWANTGKLTQSVQKPWKLTQEAKLTQILKKT